MRTSTRKVRAHSKHKRGAGDRFRCLRVNTGLMAPSLMRGDVVIVDSQGKPEQGQLVAVMATIETAGEAAPGQTLPSPQWVPTFRRRLCFAGIEIFLSDERGAIGFMMRYGRSVPVVAIDADELSTFARVPRPAELECRAAAAARAVRILEGDGFGLPSRKNMAAALKEAKAFLERIQAELAAYREKWEAPALASA